jgi:CheY-like chemotaxis protein
MQINTAVENAVRLAQTSLRKSGIKVRLELGDNLPLMEGNLQSIEQIVLNLTINSIQAIGHDQGEVKVATGLQKKDRRVFLSISDNGRGIDPSMSDKLFDPFVTDRQAEGGTGLGLSITHNLVKAHNGEITFESQKEKGTTFTVSFPTILKEKLPKILVVDDDKEIRDILTEVLTTNRPYLVDEAVNGVEACIKLGTYRPDLLILDIFMPKMDGLEVCRNITRAPELSGTKVIITTGFPDHPKLKEVAKLGFANIYSKPIRLQNLLKAVDSVLEG